MADPFQSSSHWPEPLESRLDGRRATLPHHETEPDAGLKVWPRRHSAARRGARSPPPRAGPATAAKSSDLGVCGTGSSESSSLALLELRKWQPEYQTRCHQINHLAMAL